MKKFIIVTGGSGFVGSNLIECLIKKTRYDIIILMTILLEIKKIILDQKKFDI